MKCSTLKMNTWQNEMKNAVTDPEEFLALLDLDPALLPAAKMAAALFPLRVPRTFIARMKKADLTDPLLRQVLPIDFELKNTPGFVSDPLQELTFNPLPGLLHKYHGRVLLTLTGACGINCRFCFRRHFDYAENNPSKGGWQKVLAYISEQASVTEVILSGGDPLVVSDSILQKNIAELAMISHLKRLRIHTRMPIVLPQRMTSELIDAILAPPLKTVLVTHCNHPQELNKEVQAGIQQLKNAGITVLNQTVLLKGINDNAETLIALSEHLFEMGILPYYLHVLDKVQGTAHFDLTRDTARELHWEMMAKLPGYLVPKLVSEQPGAPAKMPLISYPF